MVANHVLVRLQNGVGIGRIETLSRRYGAHVFRPLHREGFCLVSTPTANPDAVPELLAALNRDGTVVRYAEPDHILQAVQTQPNDSRFTSLWGLENTGQSGGTPDADIDAPEAWDIATGNTEVVTAVIDTGVDYTHPDLVSNIWSNPLEIANGLDDDGNGFIDDIHGWDFANDDNTPLDDQGHGTHVAGTIAAMGNNGIGVAGVNWQGRIIALKFIASSGVGATSDAVEALHYAAGLRRSGINIRLTNNSWGGAGETALSEAILDQADAGILFVTAAGNNGWDNDVSPFYPACYPWSNIITVAATDRRDARASFSQYGNLTVDLAAPGVDILSTTPNAGYSLNSGTSMAAPHVTGVAALLWSTWPDASWQDVREAILNGTDAIPAMSGITVTGGRLNARKALLGLFRILHTPPGIAHTTGLPYELDALVAPQRLTDTNAITLFWNTDGSTNFLSAPLHWVSNNLYRAHVPIQTNGTTISYWFQASPRVGQACRSPADAPAMVHRLLIVPPVGFIVSGSPDNHGTVSPDYGWYTYPSGLLLKATATAYTPPASGSRWKCEGWTGIGSAPATGTSNATLFTLSRTSAIEWHWRQEHALAQTANIGGVLNTTTWWTADSTGATRSAVATASFQGTNYMFVHWLLDGARQPATGEAANPVSTIVMAGPHNAQAVYLDPRLDADDDALHDWWEYAHFGSTDIMPGDDADGDGYSNLDEYLDRSNPHDVNSRPTPPVILHTPLSSPQDRPAPYLIEATITDNCAVASVILSWSRGSAPSAQTNLSVSGTFNHCAAFIPEPGLHGDTFTYLLMAQDARGSITTNGPHTFQVDYPVLELAPLEIARTFRPGVVSNVTLSVSNPGSTNLLLDTRLLPVGFADDLESHTHPWSHSGAGDLWTLTTNRFVSGSKAWYCGDAASRAYGPSMHARLDTPPIILGRGAQLTFRHWIQCELDTQPFRLGWKPGYAWDGGMVEISTNFGLSFQQITPVGGYSHKISGWEAAPWNQDTPCFAGTGGWQRVTFALDAFAKKSAIIRFHFGTDDNTQEEGWYLDDIAVTPDSHSNLWLTFSPSHLDLPPGASTTIGVTFDSTGIPTGDRQAAIQFACNAASTPTSIVPIIMQVRSPAVLAELQAAQTSTQGEGLVTVSNRICDADGDTCVLDLSWSVSGSSGWTNLALLSAHDTSGLAEVTTNFPYITNIRTATNNSGFTNNLYAVWNTSPSGSAIAIAPTAFVRGRLWDGLYWSDWTTSQPFMVDNEPPTTPDRAWATTHSTASWTTNPLMRVRWQRADDGKGSGLAGYDYSLTTNLPALKVSGTTPAPKVDSLLLPDGSNWWITVRARDGFGNLSAAAITGPYWIDTHPPSATGAAVTLSLNPFGHYLIAPTSLTGSWEGFTDTVSGIRNYYYAFSNQAGTTNGRFTAQTTGTLSNAQAGATNTLFVWAEDHAGLMGDAVSASCLVLDADSDQDGDGLLNAQEDVSGTDACNPASVLRLEATQTDSPGGFILRWPAATNRLYTLHFRDSLLPVTNWAPVSDFTDVQGQSGTMTYTDRTAVLPSRFYRISISPP
jgi:subtilisin family serine protease